MPTRAAELLRAVHAHPGVTRAGVSRLLGVGTGAATEIVARLSHAALVAEVPAARSGARGRPTSVLVPHPRGPLVLAAAIAHETWRVEVVQLGGTVLAGEDGHHHGGDWPTVAAELSAAIVHFRDRYTGRLRALGVAVPGTVSSVGRLDAATMSWSDVDPHELWPDAPVFVAGNDATLAALAESRRGAAVGARVAVHLIIEAGLGGAIVDRGQALLGATGAAGEFGHMPFGDPAVSCPCGARGCWGTGVDGTALARLLDRPVPPDHVAYARRLIGTAAPDSAERVAVASVAAALGRGIAGLVNGIDADMVTLGGLGADLLSAAPSDIDTAYRAGLMAYRRDNAPPIIATALGDKGPITGAAEEAWSALLDTLA